MTEPKLVAERLRGAVCKHCIHYADIPSRMDFQCPKRRRKVIVRRNDTICSAFVPSPAIYRRDSDSGKDWQDFESSGAIEPSFQTSGEEQ